MKRKWLCLLLAAVLLFAAVPALGEEEAEDNRKPDLFDLFNYGGESMTWCGVAVPLTDGMLVASAAGLPADLQYLAITDGVSVWEPTSVVKDQSGMLAIILFDETLQAPALKAYTFRNMLAPMNTSGLTVRTGDESASRINRPVLSAESVTQGDNAFLMLTLDGPVKPGSPVLTEDGELAGIVVAEWAEGEYRYQALTAGSLYASLLLSAEDPSAILMHNGGQEGLVVTMDRNAVDFDWSGMGLKQENGKTPYLVVSDTQNDYLNYVQAAGPDTATQSNMPLCPGRTYQYGIVYAEGIPNFLPEDPAFVTIPEAEPLTEFNFETVVCAFAEAPEGGLPDGQSPAVVTDITEEMLRSGRMYYYSSSRYKVDSQMNDCTLVVALYTPDGQVYLYTSGWYYDPTLNDEDTWFVSLEDAGILGRLNENGYPAGTYRVVMYVDGKDAGSFTFDLP